jgi:hypothetical protein
LQVFTTDTVISFVYGIRLLGGVVEAKFVGGQGAGQAESQNMNAPREWSAPTLTVAKVAAQTQNGSAAGPDGRTRS